MLISLVENPKENKEWGIRIAMAVVLVLLLAIPGWEVYKVGIGMGDKMLAD